MRIFKFIPVLCLSMGCVATWTSDTRKLSPPPMPSDEREWLSWPEPMTPPPPPPQRVKPTRRSENVAPAPANRLVARARKLVGLTTLAATSPHLPDDCVGLVRTVYEDSGIDLMSAELRGDNGVTAMYRFAFQRSALHTESPEPGDLVFFKDTYDRNRDQKLNDGLTHVGVVESVDEDGTVSFVHRIHGGVKRGKLNAAAPKDLKHNDYLRPAKTWAPASLTGELFVSFASALRLAAPQATASLSGRSRAAISPRPVPPGTR